MSFVNLSPDEWTWLHYVVKDLEMQPFQREALRCLSLDHSARFILYHVLQFCLHQSYPSRPQGEVYRGSEVPSLQLVALLRKAWCHTQER